MRDKGKINRAIRMAALLLAVGEGSQAIAAGPDDVLKTPEDILRAADAPLGGEAYHAMQRGLRTF
jgi:hypothetical protein